MIFLGHVKKKIIAKFWVGDHTLKMVRGNHTKPKILMLKECVIYAI